MFEVFDAAERKQEFSAVAGKSKRSFKDEIGAQAPLGFFDPLGLLRDADEAKFQRLRYVETKHGRIAMLAILGHIVTTKGDRLGGAIAPGVSFSSIKSGLAALDQIPQQEIWEIVAFIGLMEWGFSTVQQPLEEYFEEVMSAGQKWSADKIRWKKAIELNNGRAAQMGILGLTVHEKLNNDPYIINSLLGAPVPFNQ
jgi:hypothetical protein